MDCQELQQSPLAVGRAQFNPHLQSGFSYLRTREYRVPGAEISQQRRITIRGVFQGVVVQLGGLVYVYIGDGHWRRFDTVALQTRSRGWVLGQDKERKSFLDRRLYLVQYTLYWLLGLRILVTNVHFSIYMNSVLLPSMLNMPNGLTKSAKVLLELMKLIYHSIWLLMLILSTRPSFSNIVLKHCHILNDVYSILF